MLGRFLKPRWQHRDPAVRARALAALEASAPDAREILTTLARGDADASVRATAAERLTDLSLLDQLIEQDPDATVREAATRQVERLLAGLAEGAPGTENRLRLIQLTDNSRALFFVAAESPDTDCRQAAVARLKDPDHLLTLALEGPDEALRVSAAARLQSPSHLKRLTREGRDKRVLRAARENLKTLQAEKARREEVAREWAHLEEQLHALNRQTPDPLYGPRLQQLGHQWRNLHEQADADTARRIDALLEECHHKLDRWQSEKDEEERRAGAGDEQHAAVDTLERLLNEITADTWQDGTGSLTALLATQERRWRHACDFQPPPEALAARFSELYRRLTELLDQANRFHEQRPALEALLAEADAQTPDEDLRARIIEALPDWPADMPAPELLQQLHERAGQGPRTNDDDAPPEAEPARNEDAHRVLGALARELRKRNLRHANRLWHKAEGLLEEHPDAAARGRMEKLRPQLDELRDWHAFAAEPKKQTLCEHMEALANQDMEPGEKASAIQALHDEWRDLMSSDQEQDQALWDRFKAASDRAYEPCREHFRELDRERAENLARREALCDQLAEFIESQDWERADWPTVWEIRQRAPQEWKSYQPVRFTDNRDVKRRFSALLEQLDEKLRAATDAHRPQRDRLLEQMQALADEEEDPEEAGRRARDLQEQWKQAGWVHPNIYRGMNRRFRRLSDRIFQARNRQRDARREEDQTRLQALAEMLDRLEPRLQAPPTEIDMAALQADLDELAAQDCPPSAGKLRERRDNARARFRQLRERLPAWRRWRELREQVADAGDAGADDADQRQLAVALEVLAGVESPQDAREERMAWQLEKLPQAMTSGGNGDALEEVQRLMEEAALEALDANIRERLLQALDALEPRL